MFVILTFCFMENVILTFKGPTLMFSPGLPNNWGGPAERYTFYCLELHYFLLLRTKLNQST